LLTLIAYISSTSVKNFLIVAFLATYSSIIYCIFLKIIRRFIMNQNLTEIVFILDRSGSMEGLEKDTIGGFNGFVKKQAQTGQTILTTVLFDDKYEIIHNGINAEHAVLTDREYFTRGSTALLDALGKTIGNVGNRLNETPEASKPGKVIFVITTDGLENASREFSYSEIQKMINHQKAQ